MAAANTYTVTGTVTPGAVANVLLEILAPALKPLELFEFELTQQGTITSAATGILFRIGTTATTVWTAATLTPGKNNPSDAASGSTVKFFTSGTSTDGTVTTFRQTGFNVLNGYLYQPVPEARIQVPAAGYLVFKWAIAPPASVAFNVNCTFREVG